MIHSMAFAICSSAMISNVTHRCPYLRTHVTVQVCMPFQTQCHQGIRHAMHTHTHTRAVEWSGCNEGSGVSVHARDGGCTHTHTHFAHGGKGQHGAGRACACAWLRWPSSGTHAAAALYEPRRFDSDVPPEFWLLERAAAAAVAEQRRCLGAGSCEHVLAHVPSRIMRGGYHGAREQAEGWPAAVRGVGVPLSRQQQGAGAAVKRFCFSSRKSARQEGRVRFTLDAPLRAELEQVSTRYATRPQLQSRARFLFSRSWTRKKGVPKFRQLHFQSTH